MPNNFFAFNYNPWPTPFFVPYPSGPRYPFPTNGSFYSAPLSRVASGHPAAPMTPEQKSRMENLLGLNVAHISDMDYSGTITEGDVALSESWGSVDASVRLSQAMVNLIYNG